MSARHLQRGLRQRAASTVAQIESGRPHIAPIPDRSVLEISGKDAQKFLKGLTSRDVDKSPGWGYSGFLTPTGRVLYDAFIYPTSAPADVKQTYLIDYPNVSASDSAESDVPPLTNHLKRYVLRSKLKIRDVTEEYDTWSVLDSPASPGWAPERSWKFGSGGAAEITWKMSSEEGLSILGGSDTESGIGSWDLRGGWGEGSMGRRFLVRKGDKPSAASDHDIADSDAYLLRRMLNGVPEGHQEMIPGTSLPLESCMDVMGGVDFRKGCYVGQELTVRTYHTGNTRKRIMPLRFDPPSGTTSGSIRRWSDIPTDTPRPRAGDAITFVPPESAASKKPKAGVKVLSVHPDYAVGLGLVRMELVERVHGLPAFGEAGAAGSAEEVGSLVVGSVKLGDDIANNWRVFAVRGRGWYSPEEELAHQ